MDRHNIGTDATIAEHIGKVQQRVYAEKDQNGRFTPTPLGLALIEGYERMGQQQQQLSKVSSRWELLPMMMMMMMMMMMTQEYSCRLNLSIPSMAIVWFVRYSLHFVPEWKENANRLPEASSISESQ